MRQLVIQPAKEGKGRSFSALPLAMAVGDSLWDGGAGGGDTIRPIWLMAATSDEEMRPFAANLRLGRKAEILNGQNWSRHHTRLELLKSVGYHFAYQRMPEGTVLTAYLPDLFRIDPGMVDPRRVTFCVLPTKEWADAQELDRERIVGHVLKLGVEADPTVLTALVPHAALFAAYLDRRTRCPLVNDLRFYMQILCAALKGGLASLSAPMNHYYNHWDDWGLSSRIGFKAEGLESVGLLQGIACDTGHEPLEALLAEQADLYFRATT